MTNTMATRRPFLLTWSGTVVWSLGGFACLVLAANWVDAAATTGLGVGGAVLLLMVAAVSCLGRASSLLLCRPAAVRRVGAGRAANFMALGLLLLFVADALSGGVGGQAVFGVREAIFYSAQTRSGQACLLDGERRFLAFAFSVLIVCAFSAAVELFVRSAVEKTKTQARQAGLAVAFMAAGVVAMSLLAVVPSCPSTPSKGSLNNVV